jgi:hypothetical protein
MYLLKNNRKELAKMAKGKVKEEEVEEKNLLWEAIKVISVNSIKCLHPKELKAMWKSEFEKRMYMASVFGNPLVFHYLTHNKYFNCDFGIEYYAGVSLLGYFVQKGIVKTFMANNNVSMEKKRTWRDETPRSIERLKAILLDINAGAWYQKTIESEVETRYFFKCSMNPTKLEKACNDIEHKLELKKNSLSIDNDAGKTIFNIRNKVEKVYKIDDVIAGNPERPKGVLPFVLGVEYSTGKVVIKDLAKTLHLLIGGRTGMGKSTTLEAIIESLMYWNHNIAWYMIDFCVSSLPKYEDFSNVKFAGYKFEKILSMMNEIFGIYCTRRDLFEQQKVINIQEYNEKFQNNPLPYVILAIDEASGFMTQLTKEQFDKIDSLMKDLLRMGRKYGMFTIQATQRVQAIDFPIAWRSGFSRLGHSMMELDECQCLTPSKEIADKMLKLRRGELFLTEFAGSEAVKIKACYRETKKADKLYKILKKGYSNNENIIENKKEIRLEKQAI